jgi:GntR family transcriptional regulator
MWQADRPIYLQIRDIIIARILAGATKAASRDAGLVPLASVRALAAELKVNPLTVAKAYQELQAAGLIVARKGVGLYAEAGAAAALLASEREAFLRAEWPRVKRRIDQLGLSATDLFETA